jgi:crossover junction endodeoxyribonuclease RuvC
MIILGIDPGSTRAGYAFVSYTSSHAKPILLDAGILQTTQKDKNKLLPELSASCIKLIKKYKPDVAGIEKLYFVKNIKTGLEVAQSRGVIICTIAQNNIPLYEYSPLEIKQGITGYGNADKYAVTKSVQRILDTSACAGQPDDVFDAIAIALITAYANRVKYSKK